MSPVWQVAHTVAYKLELCLLLESKASAEQVQRSG